MATLSSILAWRIPWTEKPGGLQSIGSQRVGHDKQVSHLQSENKNELTEIILYEGESKSVSH